MAAKERDLMKKWAEEHLKKHPEDYWLRIPDGMYGNFKPADGILFCGNTSWMLEFKVDRRKTYKYSLKEVPDHQMMELKRFDNGTDRKSVVVVYHIEKKEWHVIPVKGGADVGRLA